MNVDNYYEDEEQPQQVNDTRGFNENGERESPQDFANRAYRAAREKWGDLTEPEDIVVDANKPFGDAEWDQVERKAMGRKNDDPAFRLLKKTLSSNKAETYQTQLPDDADGWLQYGMDVTFPRRPKG